MDCTEQQQQQHLQEEEDDEVMEVPEIDGDLLAELLDTSLAGADEEPDESTGPQLCFTADVDGWVESDELNSIHPHHDCEDCGLDDSGVLSDFDGCGCSPSPSPYAAFDDDDTAQWAETGDATLGPFVGECMGDEWYMDGMAMDWEEEDDEGNGFSFGPYYYGGEVGNTEQVYGSSLWE
ncbi:hypothetical protein PR202_ga09612 [Eleusine coracana subsp. coracana]|uniref:Uncharacterized protein n=1 Tax=Eleusine coracana subsp. coracana TaxID=191504 RepID=A0AAV5C470_ELECO|nr:hypothetical protein QOZ80_1AG0033690 [Eleusine coracana subsp. coracana]GJM93086.1 hypothetical protein PR202_ga09612 [Eleusine coracana subsp. coracana]